MSEMRPLANTLPRARVNACPLFAQDANPQPKEADNWSLSSFGVSLVALTLAEAVYRLGARALLTIDTGMTRLQWTLLLASVLVFAYGEGYRALHGRFVPHVIARAVELAASGQSGWRSWIAAPLYLLCLVQAERAQLRRAWLSVVLIAAAVFGVRRLPEPYRGIVDAGVAVALCIGLASLLRGFFSSVSAARRRARPPAGAGSAGA